MTAKKLPDSVRYIKLIVDALRTMNGVGKASAVREWIAEALASKNQPIPSAALPSGDQKFSNDIRWARMYLVNAGFLEPMETAGYGNWKLTRTGWNSTLDAGEVKSIYEASAGKGKNLNPDIQEAPTEELQQTLDGMASWETELKKVLTSMPDKGFERLCANIMTRNGLIATTVTGQTGDGGIDGEGMLAIDDLSLIKAPVAWQCKRYKDNPVSPDTIRDFRGAIEGRARFGLIFTSSTFTTQARNEARRPGATPIELVGLEDFLELMRKNEIGVIKSADDPKVHKVDQKFFEEYLNPAGVIPGQLPLTQFK